MSGERREKQTLIPAFDPEALAKELEAATDRPTITPQFDPSSYARMVDEHIEGGSAAYDTPRTMTAATPALAGAGASVATDATSDQSTTTIGRAMYGCYLSSDYPEALVLAERVLDREPDHALAKLVVDGCREKLASPADGHRLSPGSVLRLKKQPFDLVELVASGELPSDGTSQAVLDHIDGVSNVTVIAELAGVPRPEALHRLHALLDLGLLEVVNG